MSTTAVIGTIILVLVLLVAGFVVVRQTSPTTQETPVPLSVEASPANQLVPQSPGTAQTGTTTILTPTPTPTTTTSPTVDTTATTTISITDTGFVPATVTVAPNTTVTFVNNGQASHWPASAVHPTHQLVPGFDARRGLSTGETYTFTFTKSGTWPFHDHLAPALNGSVIVK